MLTMNPTRLAASLFAATLPLLGCQFIFGINEYETGEGAGAANPSSSGGNAGENAGGSGGIGGRGGNGPGPGSGGGGEGGSGGSCNCTDGDGWTYVSAPIISELGSEPTTCGGKPLINLYFGEPQPVCSGCGAEIQPGSCGATISCFNDANQCMNQQPAPAVSTSCEFIIDLFEDFDSCMVSPQAGAACTPGTSSITGDQLENVLSFCQGCAVDCAAPICAVHEEAEISCPEGLTEAYLFRGSPDGSAECELCSVSPMCNPPFYFGGAISSCDSPASSGCQTQIARVRAPEVSTNCNSNHVEPYPVPFTPTGTLRTVCCSASLDPALDAYRLN